MDERIKKKHQHIADLAGAYGSGIIGKRISYEVQFSLWLNIHRIEIRRGRSILVGISAAMSDTPNKELIESLTEDDDQSEAIYNLLKSRMEFHNRGGNGDHPL